MFDFKNVFGGNCRKEDCLAIKFWIEVDAIELCANDLASDTVDVGS